MKKNLTAILILGFTLNVACSTASNSNQTSGNHANHASQTNSTTADHANMNHAAMSHDQMQSAPNAKNAPYDLQFVDTMIAHHQGAVEMAQMAANQTQNADLLRFTRQIVADQNAEIEQMKRWREQWFKNQPSALNMEMSGMADSMKGMDMSKLAAARDKNFDLMFVEMMIPHHDGAVIMAREALQKAEHQELKTLSNQIIKSQQNEIGQMQEWKKQWAR
jgi:uncharacterized protein (DUF305 family)